MRKINSTNSVRPMIGSVFIWLCCGTAFVTPIHCQTYPPPAGAGIVGALQLDQNMYTNQPASVWCPPCTTNNPPCMLPCYFMEEKTAVAQFTFEVTNQYSTPRTFQFSSGQQFDLELSDETGRVVTAWSDDKMFVQMLTSFTLESGETKAFTADLPLQDRWGQQLNGTYGARAFLTTSGPLPRVEASTQIVVTLIPQSP